MSATIPEPRARDDAHARGNATDSVDVQRRVSLHWVAWHPTPYLDVLFRAIADVPTIDLTVHYRHVLLESHPWRTRLATGYRSTVIGRDQSLRSLLRLVATTRDAFFVVNGWADPVGVATLGGLLAFRRPFALWTDAPVAGLQRGVVRRKLRGWWLATIFLRAEAVLGMGSAALRALAALGASRTKLVDFPAPVDLAEYDAPDRTLPSGAPIVLVSSGRLAHVKGYDVAITALARVRDRLGFCPFKYRIAGEGPDREALLARVSTLGLADNVELVGWLEPDALPDFLAAGHVYLLPSRIEPFGVALIEAQASRMAVIATSCSGAAEDRVVDGVNGYLVPADDATALAEALYRVHMERDRIPSMGAAARRIAEEWPVKRNVSVIRQLVEAVHVRGPLDARAEATT